MHYKPHDYQAHATHYIETHPQAALFLDMGLGKTVITLTALKNMMCEHFTVGRALIIAPLRVARDTWPTELAKWDHLTELTMAICVGSPKQRRVALNQNADITVINRETVPWLVNHYNANDTPWPFDMVVIDELSSFKNHQAARFKALKQVRPHIRRIVGLTGTPAPNSLLDLWAPMRLIDEGQRLGKFITHYRGRYFHPGKQNGHIVYEWCLNHGADTRIHAAISDITLSMQAIDHLNLPPVTTTTHRVHLDPHAATTYRQFKRDMVTNLTHATIDAGSAGVLAGKLAQLASGAIYTDDTTTAWEQIHTAKLDALDEIIETACGHNILVAYWFKHELERLTTRFPHGRNLDTATDMADWKAGRIQLGFIHPASAGHGLNLQTGGHILVWLTPTWSLELYEQTNARLNRQGQTHPVSIIHIIAADTIDERIVEALEAKHHTQSALIDAVKAELEQQS